MKRGKKAKKRAFWHPEYRHMRPEHGSRCLKHEAARHMRQAHEMVLQAHGGGLVPKHVPPGDGVGSPSMVTCGKK